MRAEWRPGRRSRGGTGPGPGWRTSTAAVLGELERWREQGNERREGGRAKEGGRKYMGGPFVPGEATTRDKKSLLSRLVASPGTKGPHPIYLPFLRLPPALGQFLISASLVPPPSPAPTASCSPPSLSRSVVVPHHQRTRRPSSATALRRQSRGPPSPSAALSSAVPERRRRPSSPLAPVVHRRAACAVVVLDLRLARAPPRAPPSRPRCRKHEVTMGRHRPGPQTLNFVQILVN